MWGLHGLAMAAWTRTEEPTEGVLTPRLSEAAQDAGFFQEAVRSTAKYRFLVFSVLFLVCLACEVDAFQTCIELAALIAPSSERGPRGSTLQEEPGQQVHTQVRAEIPHDAGSVHGKAAVA